MLSLGLVKESSQEGIYTLYKWESVQYFCGPPSAKLILGQEGVYVDLSPDQLKMIPTLATNAPVTTNNPSTLSKILDFYESALYLTYSAEEDTFKATTCDGLLTNLFHLTLDASEPSPFRIVHQTKKPFHGIYAPLGSLKEAFSNLNVNADELWITAVPVMEDNDFKGVLVGISREQEYGLDSLKTFESSACDIKPKAA